MITKKTLLQDVATKQFFIIKDDYFVPGTTNELHAFMFNFEKAVQVGDAYYNGDRTKFTAYELDMDSYFRIIGRKGGQTKSLAKTIAAKRNIKKRWHDHKKRKREEYLKLKEQRLNSPGVSSPNGSAEVKGQT